MQLVTLTRTAASEDGQHLGLRVGTTMVAVADAYAALGRTSGPTTMLDAIEAGPNAWAVLAALAAELAADDARLATLATAAPQLLAPIPRPRKNVLCVGRNYADHAAEQGATAPTTPVFFTKAPTTVIGPDATVPYPPGVEEFAHWGTSWLERSVVVRRMIEVLVRRIAR
jgi:2-keto-4-pentenoate hydratase/2-oxohepta-3-ene-1,7-dioic acid hydratase in catechol pathway